jgi:ATP-binding cassette subfamily C protein
MVSKIRLEISKMIKRSRYLGELIISTPRYKLIIVLSLLSGTLSFLGLPMLIPLLEYLQKSELVSSNSRLLQIVDKIFVYFGVEPNFYSVLTIAASLILFGQVLIIVSKLVALYSTNELIKRYSKEIFQSYIDVDWLWLTSSHSGEINYVVLKEASLAAVCHLNAQRLVIASVQCFTLFLLAIRLSIMSVILALCVYGILMFVSLANARRIRFLNVDFNNLFKRLSNALSGLQQNKKFLKTSLLNSTFIHKIFADLDAIKNNQDREGLRIHFQTGWNFIVTFVFLISMIIFRNQLGLNYSSLFVLLLIFNRISPQFNMLSEAYSGLNARLPMHLSIKKRLKEMDDKREVNGADAFNGEDPIQFKNVSFIYPNGKKAIDNLSLIIPPYKTIAFVGGSGAGKSTILDLILGLLKPSSGEINYGDIPHFKLNLNSLRGKIAYVSQQPTLLDGTLKENLIVGCPEASDEMIDDICRKVHIDQFIDQLPEGINTRIGENGIKLSGGQRQRVVLGRSLFTNPKILILDEATSELDLHSEAMIQDAINKLSKNLTIIIVAHRLSTVKSADLIYVIEDGKLCEFGAYKDLLAKKGRLYYLDSLQKLA